MFLNPNVREQRTDPIRQRLVGVRRCRLICFLEGMRGDDTHAPGHVAKRFLKFLRIFGSIDLE